MEHSIFSLNFYFFSIFIGSSVVKRDFGSFHASNVEELIALSEVSGYTGSKFSSIYFYLLNFACFLILIAPSVIKELFSLMTLIIYRGISAL